MYDTDAEDEADSDIRQFRQRDENPIQRYNQVEPLPWHIHRAIEEAHGVQKTINLANRGKK